MGEQRAVASSVRPSVLAVIDCGVKEKGKFFEVTERRRGNGAIMMAAVERVAEEEREGRRRI